MMELQKEMIERILQNDLNGLKRILSEKDLKPDLCDEHGMTPLQHAAYKGNKEMVRLLLDQGADVNSGKHEHGYTALHFAALSGNIQVCQLLLEYGAKIDAKNSVGRTPSQMAAFVGNHSCVTTINNFVSKSDVDYYTTPSGSETEPKLPPLVAAPLHKFILEVNLNPVRIAINLSKSPLLLEHIEKVKNVLKLMSQKEMREQETSEIMSFKFHYLSKILDAILKLKKEMEQKSGDSAGDKTSKKLSEVIEMFIKKMLKCSNGKFPEYQESVLKEIVREFSNRECTIFYQMVRSLSRNDSPGALAVITSVVNGQRGFYDSDEPPCATCGEEKASKKCSQCKMVHYCDRECQKYHWFIHKRECDRLAKSKPAEENEKLKESAVNDLTESLKSEMENLKAS